MTMPSAAYATSQYDRVQAGDDLVGFSTWTAYTVNHGCWASLATIDRRHARDCAQVTVIWGNEYAIGKKALVEPHVETEIRAIVSTTPLA